MNQISKKAFVSQSVLQRSGQSGYSSESGFTIIEILVAIVLLAVLSLALGSTLLGSLGLNGQSQRQLNSTTGTQRIMENVRGAWAVQANYDTACVDNLVLPTSYTVQYTNLDDRANVLSASPTNVVGGTSALPCSGKTLDPNPPVMRRVVVSSGTGSQGTTLSVDVLRP